MTNYELHEYAEIFPPMTVSELEKLEQDIKANGLHHKITLYQGKILDGRHRYEICQRIGLDTGFEEYLGDDPLGYVVSSNLHRRHMSDSQRAMVAARLKEKGWSRANLRSGKSSEKVAAAFNVKPRTVESAVNVLRHGIPELIDAVSKGDVSVSAGEIVAQMSVAEQERVVKRGKKAIAEAASLARSTKKSRATPGHGAAEHAEADDAEAPHKHDQSIDHHQGPAQPDRESVSQTTDSEQGHTNAFYPTVTEIQLLTFVREALHGGATWVIAGKGTPPEAHADWFVHTVRREEAVRVIEETHADSQERSANTGQDISIASHNAESHTETNPVSRMETQKEDNSTGKEGPEETGRVVPNLCSQQVQFDEVLLSACRKLFEDGNRVVTIPAVRRLVDDDQFADHLLDAQTRGLVVLQKPENPFQVSDEDSCLCPATPDGKFYFTVEVIEGRDQ